jgi:hypothetical protein
MSTTQDAISVPQVFTGALQVQTGTFFYGYETNPSEWNLDKGIGRRSFDAEIKFPQPFTTPPTVMIALSGLDASNGAGTRVAVASSDVTQLDFEVVATTWADSVVAQVWGTWIAIGQ